MQLDLLRAKICPFIHPVEVSTRARRCRPRQGWIPGFEDGIPGYPDPLPSMLMLSELLRLHQFQLVIYSLLCYFFFWQQFFLHRAGGFCRISIKSRVAPTGRSGRVFPKSDTGAIWIFEVDQSCLLSKLHDNDTLEAWAGDLSRYRPDFWFSNSARVAGSC